MKSYIFSLILCMYSTYSLAGDDKCSLKKWQTNDIYTLNRLLRVAVDAENVPKVKSLLQANADPFYVCSGPVECFTRNSEIQNILAKLIETGRVE